MNKRAKIKALIRLNRLLNLKKVFKEKINQKKAIKRYL